jgi:cytochrome P450
LKVAPRGSARGHSYQRYGRAIDLDVLDPETFRDGPPHEAFRRLRAEAPVCRHPEREGPGFWLLSRHADVVAVSRDHATFSSYAGGVMTPDLDPAGLAMNRMMLLNMDPPPHTKLRNLVNRGFTPRQVARLEPRIRELADGIVSAVAPAGRCDFVTQVAGELPSALIAELMGIPIADGRRLYELTERMHSAGDPAGGQAAAVQMLGYAGELRKRKREAPADDIASVLLAAEIDGERLSDLEFDLFFLLLINAGGDTTRNLVAGGMLALLQHPEQLAALRRDRSLLPSAIEELLRWCTPVMQFRRTATRGAEIRGQRIRAGEKVVMLYPSANRDEEAFAEPDRFDVRRAPNPHVAFGGGAHFCLGASLARLEIRCLFEAILDRLHDVELDGPVERLHSWFIDGPRRMPVRFRARS